MTSERWKQIEELYRAAIEREPEEREALFANADPGVRATVEKMIAQGSVRNILDAPAWGGDEEPLAAATQLESGTQVGPYTIEGMVGQGGMGAVYRASDARLNREVAIKTLPLALAGDADRLRRFEQEARAIGALNHPNIVTVYDVGVHCGAPYLVSELLEGQTLRERLRDGKLPREEALEYARLIAAGLIAAHERGITHRDLKPENLFLTRGGRMKILDFGLAKFTGGTYGLDRLNGESVTNTLPAASEPGIIVGTVGYMSPEQVQAGPVDQRSDLFNFGLVLYEMLTGRRAFEGSTTIETLHAILKEDPQLSDEDMEVGAGLTRFLRHCLEKDPRDRFQSAKDLAFDLETLDTAKQYVLPRAARKVRLTTASAVLALFAVLLLLAAYQIWTLQPQTPPSFRQITFRSGNIAGGRFTADGQTVVFSAAWDGESIETFTTRAEGPESRSLGLPLAGIAAISPTGELALMRGCQLNWGECRGTLARVPLAGGAPREVVHDADYADWDDQGNLAVVRPYEGRYRLEYPVGKVLYETETGWISHLRFSPSKDRIAFLNHPAFGNNDGSVEVVNLNGRVTTLAAGRKGLKGLAWSPSGEEVWYSGSNANTRSPSLNAVTLSGKERVVLKAPGWTEILDIARDGRVLLLRQNPRTNIVYSSKDSPQPRNLSWFDWSTTSDLSADGSTLLFYDWGEAAGSQPIAYLRSTVRGDAVRLGEGKTLALSPDLKWALALKPGLPPGLLLLPTGAGESKQLPNPGIEVYYSGAWFPDGERILLAGEQSDRIPRTFVQDVDGGPPRPVGPEGMRATLVSPDGERLAAYGPDGEVYLMSTDGADPEPVAGTEFGDELLQWSADGSGLYVRAHDDSRLEIHRLDLAIGIRQPWVELDIPDPIGFIGIENAPGATRITPDGRAVVYSYWQGRGELYIADGLR